MERVVLVPLDMDIDGIHIELDDKLGVYVDIVESLFIPIEFVETYMVESVHKRLYCANAIHHEHDRLLVLVCEA
jgi:hypothetical protein